MSGPIHGSGVRPADCQAIDQSLQAEAFGDSLCSGPELVGVRIAALEDALGQGVGGEEHPHVMTRGGANLVDPRTEIIGEKVDEGGLGRPALHAAHLDRRAGARLGRVDTGSAPGEVVADRERGEVRSEHQPDHQFGARLDDRSGGGVDLRIGVLHPEHDVERGRCALVEGGLDRVALRGGPGGERRDAPDGGVPPGEIGQRLRGGWAAASDVGVVGLDLVGVARRAVRHQDHSDAAPRHLVQFPGSWTWSTTACSTPGSVSGWTP